MPALGPWGPGPGPRPEALEDSEYVDFSPTQELDEVVEHVQRQAQARAR